VRLYVPDLPRRMLNIVCRKATGASDAVGVVAKLREMKNAM